ncbi:unnamed protein product [Clonostachys rhizophaga]|uniref:Cyclase n=1 Tax=Clonostachys rhizophaga TaxID=160324 RepID=A0A9N9YGN5_9HYPO|nr:unnamed protein product [Clonostachys rhizophaga]
MDQIQERSPASVSFEELPLGESDPPYSAWGLWGKDDELGRTNLITSDITRKAAQTEIRTGEVVQLNLPLNVPIRPMNPARAKLSHRIIVKEYSNDDEITINTQSSTHWDGPRHYPYREGRRFYNGSTQSDVAGPNKNNRLGIQNLAERPLASRGVLLDWADYAASKNKTYDAFESFEIPYTELQEIADMRGIKFQQGDILFVRSGYGLQYNALDEPAKDQLGLREGSDRKYMGVAGSVESARWHWQAGFAAVAGDSNTYESWPAVIEGSRIRLHEVFLNGWGMPIGEQFDLEQLSRRCKELGRWTFFVTSQPLNLPAGIASPANVMAIF